MTMKEKRLQIPPKVINIITNYNIFILFYKELEENNIAKEKENEVSNSAIKNNEVKNQIPDQFNNANVPQQQNNLQEYNQGIQYLLQNNSQANNYLANQAQMMKNQLMAQQNAINNQQKMNVFHLNIFYIYQNQSPT